MEQWVVAAVAADHSPLPGVSVDAAASVVAAFPLTLWTTVPSWYHRGTTVVLRESACFSLRRSGTRTGPETNVTPLSACVLLLSFLPAWHSWKFRVFLSHRSSRSLTVRS